MTELTEIPDEPPTKAELRLLRHLRELRFGSVEVKVEDGQPVRVLVSRENIRIPRD